MKRVLHYLILAAVLFGVPYLCCLIGGYDEILENVRQFPPRTEDWGFHPEKLWNRRCPFNGWWFAAMTLFTLGCLFPLVRRGWTARRKGVTTPTAKGAFPWWGWAGILLMAASWVLSWSRFDWFRPYQVQLSYFPIWLGYIVTMNALCLRRSGRSPLTDHPVLYALTFPVSSLFWWFFEYLNRFVWNWYYLGVAELSSFEYVVYATLCFASVLPAVYVTAEFLGTFPFFDDRHYDGMAWRPDVRRPVSRLALAALSLTGLVGIVIWPQYTYLLLWISPLMVFVSVQILLGESCILDRLKAGSWGLVFRFEIAALICGLCWETWNYYACAKWVYAVPWVHRWQIWEMPLVGFAGYLPFGVECAAVTFWLYDALGVKAEGAG